ncbi:methyltransferase domain-containing protein [Candidatus Woesearchaeota archaeon]|nr:methyltransferase domain-containing protein [Candidatus Woesearchaeota archaeon]
MDKRTLLNEIYSEKFLSNWVTPHTIFTSRRKINQHVERLFFTCLKKLQKSPLSVGDVGTYYGATLFYFLSKTMSDPITYTGYDIDPAKLDCANSYRKQLITKHLQQRLSFLPHNIEKAPLPHKHDILLCVETIEHVHEVQRTLQHMFDSLQPGGFLILSTPNKRNLLKYLIPFRKNVKEHVEHDDHGKGGEDIADKLFHATIPDLDGDKHWSVMTLQEIKQALCTTGFQIHTIQRGPLIYGGTFFDNHPLLTSLANVFDEVLNFLPFTKQITFDFILLVQKPL